MVLSGWLLLNWVSPDTKSKCLICWKLNKNKIKDISSVPFISNFVLVKVMLSCSHYVAHNISHLHFTFHCYIYTITVQWGLISYMMLLKSVDTWPSCLYELVGYLILKLCIDVEFQLPFVTTKVTTFLGILSTRFWSVSSEFVPNLSKAFVR